MMGHSWLLSVIIINTLLLNWTTAQMCNRYADVRFFRMQPSVFRGTSPFNEHPLISNCFQLSGIPVCPPTLILGDADTGPDKPNLDVMSEFLLDEIGDFMVWLNTSENLYLSMELDRDLVDPVTAIELSFLNYPVQNITLPEIELYNSQPLIENTDGERLEYCLLNNQQLSSADNRRTSVTLRLRMQTQTRFLALRWIFSSVYNNQWFFLSEIRICTDTDLPPYSADEIRFQTPTNNEIMELGVQDISQNQTIELTCTISSEGLFKWRWRQNGNILNSPDFQVFTADGTRTSKLTVTLPNIGDSEVTYRCEVSHDHLNSYQGREFQFRYPSYLESDSRVNGYLGEEMMVILTCEVHGFLSSSDPPTWVGSNGEELPGASKYRIESRNGSRMAWFPPDGRVGLSIVTTLTILQLNTTDSGNYTCRTDTNQSVTELIVLEGTAPPTVATESASGGGGGENGTAVTAAVVVICLLVLVILVAIAVVLIVLFVRNYKDRIRTKLPRKPDIRGSIRRLSFNRPSFKRPSFSGSIRESIRRMSFKSTETAKSNGVQEDPNRKRLTKADIEWQLPSSPKYNETEIVYSVINKPDPNDGDGGDDVPPPIPAQNFDANDILGENQYAELQVATGSRSKPERRMTNSTSPKLAKILSQRNNLSLNSNPIYQSTNSIASTDSQVHQQLDSNPLYAEPLKPSKVPAPDSGKNSSQEAIYSEALNPTLFTQEQQSGVQQESELHPFYPVYAEPLPLNSVEEPIKITSSSIREIRQIGVGQFGEVVLAETVGLSLKDLKLSPTDDTKTIHVKVAVKKLKPQAQNQVRENFEKEIKFMSHLKDENIVRLLAISKGLSPFIVMEYMENGDLHQFMSKHEPAVSDSQIEENQLPVSILLYMALQISSGMRYLASLNYVHRDLATRNCLVGKNFVVKIADFGMSRSLYESSYYRVRGRAMLPIRWMATESFYGRFSEKSDVWSFGVVMWEIFTLGKMQPYEEMDDQEVIQDAIRVTGRKRLKKPVVCPVKVYDVMLRCWEYAKDDRATFDEIFTSLAAIHQQM